jgi:hypothetical protein
MPPARAEDAVQTETDRTSWHDLQRRIAGDVPIYLIAGALLAFSFGLFWAYDVGSTGAEGIPRNAQLYLTAGLAMVFADLVWQLVRHRPAAPTQFLLARYRSRLAEPETLAGLPLLAIAIAFMPFFSTLKSMIPLFNHFGWDPAFIAWDRALFFGHDAADVLQPLLGYPPVTALLAVLYHAWIMLIYAGVLFFLFYRAATPVRRQYFLGFVLIWTVIGGGLATVFASVGPCFVGPIFGDGTFDSHMAYLRAANEQIPVLTLNVQDLLLQWYRESERGLGSGITAMPSMHVAMAQLTWLGMRRVSRTAGWWFFAFFATIWIASVHLAYHYAVDGLVSVIATTAIWSACGALLRAWDRRIAPVFHADGALPA